MLESNENVIHEHLLFSRRDTQDRLITVCQLSGMTAEEVMRQTTLHLIIYDLPSGLQFALGLLGRNFNP